MGWDLSPNHGGFVELKDGHLYRHWYVTNIAGAAAKSANGHRITPDILKIKDPNERNVQRLAWWEEFLSTTILGNTDAGYIGIEDYALDARMGHMKGEIGGLARLLCWNSDRSMRLHDPCSIKMFVTHSGNCQKDEIERAVLKRWGQDFSNFNLNDKNHGVSEDLADAFAIARLVWTEVQLRNGEVLMSDLHEKEVRVFNRITKTYPVSLLDRDWIRRI